MRTNKVKRRILLQMRLITVSGITKNEQRSVRADRNEQIQKMEESIEQDGAALAPKPVQITGTTYIRPWGVCGQREFHINQSRHSSKTSCVCTGMGFRASLFSRSRHRLILLNSSQVI